MIRRFLTTFACGCNNAVQKQRKNDNENENEFDNVITSNEAIPFVPPISSGFVVKVYDGDTITIISRLPYSKSELYKFSVRLSGIDCPEIKGHNIDEKQCALLAKAELEKLILNKDVTLKNLKTEKYGRILADVYLGDLHINKQMLDKCLAVEYDGGTKKTPKSWMEYYTTKK